MFGRETIFKLFCIIEREKQYKYVINIPSIEDRLLQIFIIDIDICIDSLYKINENISLEKKHESFLDINIFSEKRKICNYCLWKEDHQ